MFRMFHIDITIYSYPLSVGHGHRLCSVQFTYCCVQWLFVDVYCAVYAVYGVQCTVCSVQVDF